MSTLPNPKLPNFLKGLLDLIFGLLVFGCIALILLILFSPLILKGAKIPLTASLPVGFGSAEAQHFNVQVANAASRGIQSAFVDQAQGTLRLETQNWSVIFFSYMAKLVIALGLTFIIYQLRAVLQGIIKGEPFSVENGLRIRRIGTMVLVLGFIFPTVEYIAANEILRGLQIEPALSPSATFKAEFILTSLLILLLAQVWLYGVELKRDQELTI